MESPERDILTPFSIPLSAIQKLLQVTLNMLTYTSVQDYTLDWTFSSRFSEGSPLNAPRRIDDKFPLISLYGEVTSLLKEVGKNAPVSSKSCQCDGLPWRVCHHVHCFCFARA
jgi:hypothetical protein